MSPSAGILFFYYDDLPAAVRWYRQELGFDCVLDEGWVAILRVASGAYIGLVNATHGTQRPTGGDNKGALLSFEVTDLASWHALMQARGVEIVRNMGPGSHGLTEMFQIRDPGGYLVEFFAWRRGAPLSDRDPLA